MKILLVVMTFIAGAGLVALAMWGNVWAVGILFSVWTLLCVVVGAGIVAYVSVARARAEQSNFAANAKENLAIMQMMQRVQNLQNQNLLSQVSRLPQLPAGENSDSFIIDESIFAELE